MGIIVSGGVSMGTTGTVEMSLQDLSNVSIGSLIDGQYLRYDSVEAVWKNITLTGVAGEIVLSGTTIGLADTGVVAGTYTKVTTDAKGRVTAGTNPTTLAGYGITDAQALDADLTAIGALAGTTGILRKTAANTWSLDTATYSTTAGTVTGVTGTAPVVSSGGTAPIISMAAATSSVNGYLTSADWNIFSGKQASDADLTAIAALAGTTGLLRKTAANTWSLDTATYLTGNQTITLTGDVSGTGTGSFTTTLASVGTSGVKGSASSVPVFTTDVKGRVTANTDTAIAISAAQTTSGTFADARIASTNVTQHQASLSIAESQITDGTLLARLAATENVTGSWTFSSPVSVATPTVSLHAATKQYVDNAIAGLSWKNSATVATTDNITLSGVQTIDGIAVVAGQRVLVKNQTTTSQNGVYVAAAGAWVRAEDFDSISPIDEINSAAVFVELGTTQSDTAWTQVSPVVVVGTDAITFTQFAGASTFVAGAGLVQSGNTFNVATANTTRIVINADSIDLSTVGTSGTYRSVTTDAYGRVTAGTNPTTLAGYGITDAQALDVDLTAIGALAGTTGILRKTAANTWSLDTATYLTTTPATNLSYTTAATSGTVVSSTGTNATLPAATTALAGLMTNADKSKLDGISTGAQANATLTADNGATPRFPVLASGTGTFTEGFIDNATTPLSYVPSTGTLSAVQFLGTSATLTSDTASIVKGNTTGVLVLTGGTTIADGGSIQMTGNTNTSTGLTAYNAREHLFRGIGGTPIFGHIDAQGIELTTGTFAIDAAPSASTAFYINSGSLVGPAIAGQFCNVRGTATSLTSVVSFVARVETAASTTVGVVRAIEARDAIKGASGTITNQTGVWINDQTGGDNNYGLVSLVSSSGTPKWNLYVAGTAPNSFAGNVRIGSVVAPTQALDVTGNVLASGTITGSNISGTNTGDQSLAGLQPLDADLTAIGALAGTTGILRKTAANTWSLDTAAYLTTTPATNLSYTTAATTGTVTSSTGTNAILPAATNALAGLMTGTDKLKLDGIAAGATVASVTSVAGKTGAVSLVKVDVGLGFVDNTNDAAKPVSTAQQTALNLKANIDSPTFTGTVSGITAAMVGAQPLDLDLTAIGALAGTTGLLRKTAANTWSLDTATYLTGNQGLFASGTSNPASGSSVEIKYSGTAGFILSYDRTASLYKDMTYGALNHTFLTGTGTTRAVISDTGLNVTGTVTATSFSGPLTGNASTATALATARTINGVSFNGTENITVADATKLPLVGGTLTGALIGTTITATSFNATSTQRVKQAITDLSGTYLDKFNQLKPREYDRTDYTAHEFGFIAEEMAQVYPEVVGRDSTGQPSGIDYGKLSTILTAKVQEQQTVIQKLQSQMAEIMSLVKGLI